MISVLVITHDGFATGIAKSVAAIVGPQESFKIVEFDETESVESFSQRILTDIEAHYTEAGMLVFVDLLGATPANVTASLLSHPQLSNKKISILTGVNLPMLFEALLLRETETDLTVVSNQAILEGKEGILNLAELLKNNNK